MRRPSGMTSIIATREQEPALRPAPLNSGAVAEVDCFAFLRTDRDLHFLCAKLFVPGLDRIAARWQALNRERAILAGYCEERMPHDPDVRTHPRMHIALH